MSVTDFQGDGFRPAGYTALIKRLGITAMPHWHESTVAPIATHRVEVLDGVVRETYPGRYWPGDSLGNHLEFALKYDGVNLAILTAIFAVVSVSEITAYIQSKPTGKYARRVWYLYELVTGKQLPLDDITRGNYVDLLEADTYVTTNPAKQISRQRINDNLLGDERFCPIIRRTDLIDRFVSMGLKERCQQVMAAYSPELLRRALGYLYTKETKSSFEIEHIKPDANRTERFIALLQSAEKEDFCNKPRLVELQNRIVDSRFAAADYRTTQNYVGETIGIGYERVHFACPKAEDLHNLMAGLIAAHQHMGSGGVHPVIHAAAIAYGFVFLHPFEDGNGRIHRFLIHNILARRDFTPKELMFPVSAAMLKNPAAYDASLESFSRPLMPLVEYTLDDEGRMVVHNDTSTWYRFIDMTPQVEALFSFIEKTINTELVDELAFLANYDRTKVAIQAVVDMPDHQIDLFIRFCLQNHGRLSTTKRHSHFDFLSTEEIAQMEQAVQVAYGKGTSNEHAE